MDNYKHPIIEEKSWIDERIKQLKYCIDSLLNGNPSHITELYIGGEVGFELDRKRLQLMEEYSDILAKRIEQYKFPTEPAGILGVLSNDPVTPSKNPIDEETKGVYVTRISILSQAMQSAENVGASTLRDKLSKKIEKMLEQL